MLPVLFQIVLGRIMEVVDSSDPTEETPHSDSHGQRLARYVKVASSSKTMPTPVMAVNSSDSVSAAEPPSTSKESDVGYHIGYKSERPPPPPPPPTRKEGSMGLPPKSKESFKGASAELARMKKQAERNRVERLKNITGNPSWKSREELEERKRRILAHDFTPDHPVDRARYNERQKKERLDVPLDEKTRREIVEMEEMQEEIHKIMHPPSIWDRMRCKVMGYHRQPASIVDTAKQYDLEEKLIKEVFGPDCPKKPKFTNNVLFKYTCALCGTEVDEISAFKLKMEKKYGKIKRRRADTEGESLPPGPDYSI